MSEFTREFWESAAVADPYNLVRKGWTADDFDARTDDTFATRMTSRPGDVVLDYGCGPGYACKIVAPLVTRYVGMDYSAKMLELARRRNAGHANAEFVECDGLGIPFADATFDCIFCELVFQHNYRSATMAIAAEMMRVLKPAGRAMLQFPTLVYGPKVGFEAHEVEGLCPGGRVTAYRNYFYSELGCDWKL